MGDSSLETGAPFPGSGSWKGTIFGTFSKFAFMQENLDGECHREAGTNKESESAVS
jgi:hypothetical protein